MGGVVLRLAEKLWQRKMKQNTTDSKGCPSLSMHFPYFSVGER